MFKNCKDYRCRQEKKSRKEKKRTDEPQRCITHYAVDLLFFIFSFCSFPQFSFLVFFLPPSLSLSLSLSPLLTLYASRFIKQKERIFFFFFSSSMNDVNDSRQLVMMIHLFSKYISFMSLKCLFFLFFFLTVVSTSLINYSSKHFISHSKRNIYVKLILNTFLTFIKLEKKINHKRKFFFNLFTDKKRKIFF